MVERGQTKRQHGRRYGIALLLLLSGTACGANEFQAWARDVCVRNDQVDREVTATLPRTNIAADAAYLEKVQDFIARKQALKTEVTAYQPPITHAALHNKLSITLNNSIRYLRALEGQYTIATEAVERMGLAEEIERHPSEINTVMREVVSDTAAFRVDPREVLMRRQYEKLYAEVRAELGMELLNF